ncbi:MAG: DUF262 domain-containing protein [Gammaproteobacteria bacterium]|nr:DUF262 domain-containing protein [Gammaproteobacteria bacterium]MCY4275345.1 DUF262 domain-containing protein [Gammaproteobacteria bacterium]
MADFKYVSYNVASLLDRIKRGEIGLPEIQRPFVWSNTKVRDLIDSMYIGFPVGSLLLWSTGADADAKQIGTDHKQAVSSLLSVDGQQRLTSLYAVICGIPILRKDYREGRISITFRPHDQKFEVADAAVKNDPEFIADITEVFAGSLLSFATEYLAKVEAYRDVQIGRAEKEQLVKNIE